MTRLVLQTCKNYQKIQNIAPHVILKPGNHTPVDWMYKELKLLKLHDRHQMHILSECFKHVNTLVVNNFGSSLRMVFVSDLHTRITKAGTQKRMFVVDF